MNISKRATSPIIFQIDTKLKERAMKKAQVQGVPLASVLKFATKAFVDGEFHVGLVPEQFNEPTKKRIRTALKDAASGKNISPRFRSSKDAIRYLGLS